MDAAQQTPNTKLVSQTVRARGPGRAGGEGAPAGPLRHAPQEGRRRPQVRDPAVLCPCMSRKSSVLSALSGGRHGAQRRGERDAATGHTGGVNDALITADGARVLTLSKDCTARVWDAATGACLHVLVGHSDTCGPAGRIRSCWCHMHWRGGRIKDIKIVSRLI